MEVQSRQFVRRILAVHGLLLLTVLALVVIASISIYRSARMGATIQAQQRQELLANQTCRSLETFFNSIISDLDWLGGPQATSTQTPAETNAQNNITNRLERGPATLAVQLIADELGDRVSMMFVYNKQTGEVISTLPDAKAIKKDDLSPEIIDWLSHVTTARVSRFVKLKGQGVSLIAAPFSTAPLPPQGGGRGAASRPTARFNNRGGIPGAGGRGGRGGGALPAEPPGPRLLVTVVPAAQIEASFLQSLTEQNSASATLTDADLQVITTSNPELQGMNLSSIDNADLRQMVADFQKDPETTTKLFDKPIMGPVLGPRLVTLTPVLVGQDPWLLLFSCPVATIDAQVNQLFQQAVIWAAFVAASITAILVSTAVQMIRVRSRVENIRHQVLTRELTQARRIQEQWLPDPSSVPENLDIAAINRPASHISGDFYNWFDLPDGRHVVVIGDVTGHGMAAAFLMATTQLLVRNTMARLADPGAAMEDVNRQLTSQVFHGQFVTMLIVTLDAEHKKMEIATAGHPAPLLIGRDGLRRLALEPQLVLGVEKTVSYPTVRMPLPEGSSLVLYTDGMPDARGPSGERFGLKRLTQSLAAPAATAHDMISSAIAAVEAFRGDVELDDDLTMVAIQLRKMPAVRDGNAKPAVAAESKL